jgi:flagellar motility protein MotE (MotC chaperone)
MKNDLLVYVLIALGCLLINGTFIFFLMLSQPEIERDEELVAVDPDSLDVIVEFEPESEEAEESEPAERRRQYVDAPDFFEIDESTLSESELAFVKLQQMLYIMRYGEPELMPEEEPVVFEIVEVVAEIDSTMIKMAMHVEELESQLELFQTNNEQLTQSIGSRDGQIEELRNSIAQLNLMIETLQSEITILRTPPPAPTVVPREPDFRQLARVYNNMDAKKVASLMQSMSDEHSVSVLKAMNQRKVAQIMATLPPAKATAYSRLLANL